MQPVKDQAWLLREKKAFFFDLDGCVYYTNVLAEGADRLIAQLQQDGKHVGFITNNSRETAEEIAAKLQAMGLSATSEQIFTATEVVGRYILDRYGVSRVKVVGSSGLSQALSQNGHEVLPLLDAEYADFIVVGRDTEFTYEKLAWIARESDRGTVVISANSDLTHPGSQGEKVPETGALIAAIEAVTGTKVDHTGKPSPFLFQYAMARYEVTAEDSVMVGDNYFTDILGGKGAAMSAVWIDASGESEDLELLASRPNADLRIPYIRRLFTLLYPS